MKAMTGPHDGQLVLVVEDSVLVAMAIEDALIERGLAVVVATTVAAAEQLAEAHMPDVALLDLQLPDGLTLDLARRLRDAGCAVAISSGLDSGAVPESHNFAIQFRKPTSPDLLADWAVTSLQAGKLAQLRKPVPISSCSRSGTG
ncbi:MAG: response regulator [Novosphingobium sp.]